MAISIKLNARRRTTVATGMRLPRYARNDKVGARGLNRREQSRSNRRRAQRTAGVVTLCRI